MNTQYYTGINVLTKIVYQQVDVACFPIFQKLPLTAGFSWGEGARDMSYKNNKERAEKAHKHFFSTLHLPTTRVLIDPNIPTRNQLIEVSSKTVDNQSEMITGSNIIFTTDATITLMAHPGDCPCVIIFAKDKKKQPILGLIHLGRQQTDARLAAKAIEYLKKQKILMSDIFVAICPGISQKNYFIPVNKQVKDLPNASMWSNHKEISTIAGEERMYLDLSGYVVEQLLMSGVWAEHIELYDVDTYAAAEKGESFSHRYATVTHNLEKDGRFLLAASLG